MHRCTYNISTEIRSPYPSISVSPSLRLLSIEFSSLQSFAHSIKCVQCKWHIHKTRQLLVQMEWFCEWNGFECEKCVYFFCSLCRFFMSVFNSKFPFLFRTHTAHTVHNSVPMLHNANWNAEYVLLLLFVNRSMQFCPNGSHTEP